MLTGLNEFIDTFGSITIANVIEIVLACIFGVFVYKKIKDYLIKKHESDKKIVEAIETIPTLKIELDELKKVQAEYGVQLHIMQEKSDRRERNKLRDRLLQSYRYYTNQKTNPMQAWTENESSTFWDLFSDYEDAGGNGFIHTEVQPAMNRLIVINVTDYDKVMELIQSRK